MQRINSPVRGTKCLLMKLSMPFLRKMSCNFALLPCYERTNAVGSHLLLLHDQQAICDTPKAYWVMDVLLPKFKTSYVLPLVCCSINQHWHPNVGSCLLWNVVNFGPKVTLGWANMTPCWYWNGLVLILTFSCIYLLLALCQFGTMSIWANSIC